MTEIWICCIYLDIRQTFPCKCRASVKIYFAADRDLLISSLLSLDLADNWQDSLAANLPHINRALRFGGLVILYMYSVGSLQPLLDYRVSLLRLAAGNGFSVSAYLSGGAPPCLEVHSARRLDEDASDERCWRLAKVSETLASPQFLKGLDWHREFA